MPEVNTGVSETSPSPLADAIASSPEALAEEQQAQEAQTPSAEKGVTQEQEQQQAEKVGFGDPRHPDHERFVELHEQNKWLKQQLEQQMQRTQQPLQQPIQPQEQELGNTPEEREFWRAQRKIAREEAQKVSQEQLGQIRPVIDAGRMELAQMKVQQFRAQHTDIRPNSPEEMAIAEKITMGYLPEDAYRAVMWDSKVVDTEKQVKQEFKQKIETKRQANVEQRSIPQGGLPPVKEKLTLRERISREADKLDWTE